MTRLARTVALTTACVLLSAVSATAETDAADPTVTWDALSYVTEAGMETAIAGTVAGAGDEPELAVEKQVGGGWSPVESHLEQDHFVAKVPGETAIYRAVLTSGEVRTVSSELAVVAEGAESDLGFDMPASAKDKSTITATITWRRTSDASPISGEVALEFKRRGLETWTTLRSVPVVNGAAAISLTPRDDGMYVVRWAGDDDVRAVESAPVDFDNVPTVRATLRLGQLNLPGADKLKRATVRAAKAASLIKSVSLDVVTFNELVGPTSSKRPSQFARSVLKALGSKWRIITPTMGYNENYIAYRPDRVELITQYPDRIVPGVGTGTARKKTGRHVTPVLFKDRSSNQPVLIVATHLVNNNRAGARTQAYAVGSYATELSSGYPVLVAGDMNTSDQLRGLTSRGLKDARRNALKRTNASYATYVKYSGTKPRKDASWIIDQTYVPRTWTVSRWKTELGTKKGTFTKPRVSDHLLVWSDLVGPRT